MIWGKETIIIEGHHIHPTLISELIKRFDQQNIRAVVLSKSYLDQMVETARKSEDDDDWFIKKTAVPKIYYKIAAMLSKYSDYFSEEAKK